MLTLSVIGPNETDDRVIENPNRQQIDAVLDVAKTAMMIVSLHDQSTSAGVIYQLGAQDPNSTSATVSIFSAQPTIKHVFNNIPDAISAFHELIVHLFN
jgi:hypothetical protein